MPLKFVNLNERSDVELILKIVFIYLFIYLILTYKPSKIFSAISSHLLSHS